MGWDLEPLAPTPDAPRDASGNVRWGRYNVSGWVRLVELLDDWGVDTDEFSGTNDGDPISAETCRRVADAIERQLPGLGESERAWLGPHVVLWRTCGGYAQF